MRLGASWGLLGASWSVLGSSGDVVGGFGEVLERIYEVREVSGGGAAIRRGRISGPLRGKKVGR